MPLLTMTSITREALRVKHNNGVFLRGVNKEYSDQFARSGAKIGSTINIRLPNQYYVRLGPQLSAQGTNEQTVPLTLTTQYGVDVNFTMVEMELSLDDFGKRILTPAMARMSSREDQDLCKQAAYTLWNTVGFAGTSPGPASAGVGLYDSTAPQVFLNADVLLANAACPDFAKYIMLSPAANASSIASLTGLLNPQTEIGEQYRKGLISDALGFEFARDQNISYIQTGGHGGNPVVSGSGQQYVAGSPSQLVTSGWTANALILYPGEVFTIAGVYNVNPETQESTGQLQQFVVGGYSVIANPGNPPNPPTFSAPAIYADSNGFATIPIMPQIIPAGVGVANGTVDSSPLGNAAITLAFPANHKYECNIAYQRDAFTMGTCDLDLPGGVDLAARENYEGLAMRVIRAYDIRGDQMPCRVDMLAGYATLRGEFGVKIMGALRG